MQTAYKFLVSDKIYCQEDIAHKVYIANQISVLQRGAVLAEGTYDEVSKNPLVLEAYMGTVEVS
jgi:ABC-type branched-subunit amino acid transport system ATPase component